MSYLGWRSSNMWISGRKVNGVWRWNGRLTSEFMASNWGAEEPNSSGDCLRIMYDNGGHYHKWDDYVCSGQQEFICEKIIQN
jgi:hypothetical protein